MLAFGPFQLDPERRELLRDGERFPVQAKLFDTLAYLVEHRDRIVDKQELLDRVWPDTYVGESTLFQTVSALRKALGRGKADGERYIATIPGRGYRFVAQAAPVAPAPAVNGKAGVNGFHKVAEGPAEQAAESLVVPEPRRAAPEAGPFAPRRRRLAVTIAAAAAVVLVGAMVWRASEDSPGETGPLTIRKLTSLEGTEWQPGWSPDARSFAYSGTAFGSADIFVTATAGGQPLRRTTHPADDLQPRWSPDGRYIAFLSDRGEGASIYIMSPFEGPERKIADTNLHRDVALLSGLGSQPWSPDSDSLLFPRRDDDGSIAVWRHQLSSGTETQLTSPPPGVEDRDASFSFDGEHIAFRSRRDGKHAVWIASSDGRIERRLEPGNLPTWSPDGRSLYVSRGDPINIWRFDLESGGSSRVTLGAGQDLFPAIAANGSLAYSSFSHTLQLYRTHLPDGRTERLTKGTERNLNARVSPDGSLIAFESDRTGNKEIWVLNLTTGEEVQLTRHPAPDTRPDWSPNGEKIVFLSGREGEPRLWIMDAQGGPPHRLSSHGIPQTVSRTASVEANSAPRWSPDGSRIGYIAPSADGYALWLTSLDGKAEPIASTSGAVNFGWYRDETRVILTRIGDHKVLEMVALNLATGQSQTLHRGPHYELEVAPDGSAVSFSNGISHANQNLFVLRLSPPAGPDGLPQALGPPAPATDGKGVWHVHNGGWFPDGESVVYTRDTDQADIFMVEP